MEKQKKIYRASSLYEEEILKVLEEMGILIGAGKENCHNPYFPNVKDTYRSYLFPECVVVKLRVSDKSPALVKEIFVDIEYHVYSQDPAPPRTVNTILDELKDYIEEKKQ